MKVRFFDFSTYHGKFPPAGSTQIRVHQLIKYWPEASIYKYGEHPEVLIFQKVYCSPDYKFPLHYPGIKILDICDPDWMNGLTSVRETVEAVDAVVCSSDNLTSFMKQMTDKPVLTVPDRFDLDVVPKPISHRGDAKTVVWFGYRHNAETLRSAMPVIHELGLSLIIISDDDPMAWQWLNRQIGDEYRENKYRYIRYDEDRIYYDLQRADIAVLPDGIRPIDPFKSNNRTVKATLAGLPVAKDADQLRYYIKEENRKKFVDDNYDKTRDEYDVVKSIEQYKSLIKQIQDD